jgi:hypothetical protein
LDKNKAENNKIRDSNHIKFNQDKKRQKYKKNNDPNGKKSGAVNRSGGGSVKTNFICHLKKTITFASIAASNSNSLINVKNEKIEFYT